MRSACVRVCTGHPLALYAQRLTSLTPSLSSPLFLLLAHIYLSLLGLVIERRQSQHLPSNATPFTDRLAHQTTTESLGVTKPP